MEKHKPSHEVTPGLSQRRDCYWLDREFDTSTLAGFGYDRCNEHVEAVIGGLRYSTRTAELIAVNDGVNFGLYVFRTKGGRYFTVRVHYPLRYDSSEPLDPISVDAAKRLWNDCAVKSYAAAAPYDEAFPGHDAIEEA